MNDAKVFRDKAIADRIHTAEEEYEESIVNLLCRTYEDARGAWPHERLEEALRYAVRGNVIR